MKINFRRFMAMMLAVLMVFGTFSTLATAAGTATADVCSDGGDHDWIQLGDDKTAIVDPTCTEDGYTWYYCVKCNAKDIRNIKPALGHDFVPSTVKPTCKVDGKYIETCSRCGVTQNEQVLKPTTNIIVDFDGSEKEEAGFWVGEHWVAGHRFEWVLDPSTPDPKCGEVAVYWLTCTDHGVNPTDICGWVKEGPVYMTAPHNFGAEDAHHVVKEPTCSEYGIMRFECEHCDEYKDVKIEMLDHDLGDVIPGKAPTCTEPGWTDYQECANCDYNTKKPIDPLGHNHVAVKTTATCTTPGYTTYTCACGDTYIANETAPLGHAKRVEITKAPTCTENGEETWFCWRCPEIIGGRSLPALGHDWSDWTYTDGNCQTEATATRTCPVCEEVETQTFEKGDHVKPAAEFITETVVKDPTNRENSYCAIVYVCEICGQTVTEKVEHRDMTYGEIQKHPTCTEEGVKADYCGACGYFMATFIDPTGHNYVETVVPPTCTEQGYSTYKCCNVDLNTATGVTCGDELEKGNFVPALGHTPGRNVNYTSPTCTEDAVVSAKCLRCDYDDFTAEEILTACGLAGFRIEKYGHNPAEDDGDCTTPVLCTRCSEVVVPAAANHTYEDDGDCTTAVVCEVCNKVIVEAKDEHTPDRDCATCKDDQICTVCGKVLEESAPDKHPQDDSITGIAITRWPTCTEGAKGTLFCHLCDTLDKELDWETMTEEEKNGLAKWIYDLLDPAGHDLVHVDAKVPTCQASGYEAFDYCTKCSYSTRVDIPADPNNHSDLGYHTKGVEKEYNGVMMRWARTPSCYADGLVWYYCGDCAKAEGATYNGWTEPVEGSTLNCHDDIANYGDLIGSVAPTCTTTGVNTYKCTHTYDTVDVVEIKKVVNGVVVGVEFDYRYTYDILCGKSVDVTVDKLPHTPANQENVSAPTCTEAAVVKVTCSCGYEFTAEELAKDWPNISIPGPLGHDIQNHAAQDPTCTEIGWDAYETCSRCEYSTYVEKPALGHKFGDWTYQRGELCTSDKAEARYCPQCQTTEYRAAEHDYDSEVIEATCTKGGRTEYTCSVCNHFYYDSEVAPLGHDYDVVTTDPTCTEDGSKIGTCKREDCDKGPGFGYIEILPAIGHKYVAEVFGETCSKDYHVVYTCENCGDSYTNTDGATKHVAAEMLLAHMCGDDEDCIYGNNFKAPTCTEPGVGYGRLCQVCGECVNQAGVDHVEIPALGALGGKCDFFTFDIPVGCENYGFTYTICTRCGDGYGVATQLRPEGKIWNDDGKAVEGIITNYKPATGHDMKTDGKEDATCTEDGYYYEYCANDCGLKNVIGDTIPALGHDAPNHKDADGNYLDLTVKCGRCGKDLPGHRDAEGNSMFEYRTDMEVTLGANDECIKTCYKIAYCPDEGCEYKKVVDIWLMTKDDGQGNPVPDFDHDMVPDEEFNAAYGGDEVNNGEYKEVCAYGCGHFTIDDDVADLDGQIIFDNEIYGSDEFGNVRGDGMIVNGGYMAVKIDISGANLNIWGIQIDMTFDAAKLEFAKDLTEAANVANGFSNQFNSNGGKLKIVSTYDERDENNNRKNLEFSALDVDYITLIFAVKSTAYGKTAASILADAFTYTNVEVEDIDHNSPSITPTAFGETRIWKAADLDASGTLSLGDTNDLMDFVVNFADGAYDARADINWDGEIDGADFRAIKKILMNEGLYEGVYEDILDGYIEV